MATQAPPVAAGPAHVAVVSFLAARAAPSGGFWIALAGGVALARVGRRAGARLGYGTSIAAMLETVAIIGPARFGTPLTQAATAPLLGRFEARGIAPALQMLACAAIRLLHNTAATAFFIWIVAGGLDAYAGTYESLAGRIGLELGTPEVLVLTGIGLLLWAAFASVVQVLVYRRGLREWEQLAREEAAGEHESTRGPTAPAGRRRRFDPRAVSLAAAIAFALLLSSTAWPLLAAVAVWLALAWGLSRGDREPLATGLAFTAILAGGALLFSLGGGLGLDTALRRASRAALLVLVATWLRSAAGADGLREVSRRVLGRLRRVPAMAEAGDVLDGIASEGRLVAAGRSLGARLGAARKRPLPLLDAALAWVVGESEMVRPAPPARVAAALVSGPLDLTLVLLAAAPALALAGA